MGISYGNKLRVTGFMYMVKHPSSIFQIGHNVRINSGLRINPFGGEAKMIFSIGKNAKLKIGNNVGISNASIHCQKEIIIEDNVYIGGGVKIIDTDFHSINYNDRLQRPDLKVLRKPVLIKNGAFVGGYSIISKGVIIGEKAVIGAGSVVTKSVPDNEIWGGNPAQFLKKIQNC